MFHLRSATVDVNILRLASSGKFAVLVSIVPENSGQRKAAKLPKEAETKADLEVDGISELCLFLHSKACTREVKMLKLERIVRRLQSPLTNDAPGTAKRATAGALRA